MYQDKDIYEKYVYFVNLLSENYVQISKEKNERTHTCRGNLINCYLETQG